MQNSNSKCNFHMKIQPKANFSWAPLGPMLVFPSWDCVCCTCESAAVQFGQCWTEGSGLKSTSCFFGEDMSLIPSTHTTHNQCPFLAFLGTRYYLYNAQIYTQTKHLYVSNYNKFLKNWDGWVWRSKGIAQSPLQLALAMPYFLSSSRRRGWDSLSP